jgi:hypothetical protein
MLHAYGTMHWVSVRGEEKDDVYGDSVCQRFKVSGSRVYEMTSKAKVMK